jgi:NAD(P)-dependent dehydrogenase (short-subunit alcohol dehydrogenase family)
MSKLTEKIALVTGGNSGIGLATAQKFVEEGAFVFIAARRKEELEKAKAAIGRQVTVVQTDVTKMEDLDHLFARIKNEKGNLDIVFANAGRGEFLSLEKITERHVDEVLNLNLKAVLFTVQKALPVLNDGGSIILTSSIAAIKGFPGLTVYAAAKAGLRAFARVWANELKDRRIRTNILTPGPVNTPPIASAHQEAINSIVSSVPLGRIAQAKELADAALFLASDEASFVNGTELFVDGGAAQV